MHGNFPPLATSPAVLKPGIFQPRLPPQPPSPTSPGPEEPLLRAEEGGQWPRLSLKPSIHPVRLHQKPELQPFPGPAPSRNLWTAEAYGGRSARPSPEWTPVWGDLLGGIIRSQGSVLGTQAQHATGSHDPASCLQYPNPSWSWGLSESPGVFIFPPERELSSRPGRGRSCHPA